MEKQVLNVEGMSCSHCENAVVKAVGAIDGVGGVQVDWAGRTVTVQYDPPATLDGIKSAIEDEGYEVV